MLTTNEARSRILRGDKGAALQWLEQVGAWPSSDPVDREVTQAADRLLKMPRIVGSLDEDIDEDAHLLQLEQALGAAHEWDFMSPNRKE